MKRFLSQLSAESLISNKKSSKPHLVLRNALTLSRPAKIMEFYEKSQPQEIKLLNNQEILGVLRTYLNTSEPRNYTVALDLIKILEERNYNDDYNLDIQKLIVLSGDSIEAVVKQFKSTVAQMEKNGVAPEKRANFYAGFMEIVCTRFNRLQAGLAILEQMVEKEITPTPKIILTILKSTTFHGDIDTALKLFKRIEFGEFGFGVDRNMLIQTAKTVAMGGDATHVAYMMQLNTLKEWSHDVDYWLPVIMAFEKSGNLDGAIKKYEQYRRKGIQSNLQVLESLMRAYSNNKDVKGCIRMYGVPGIMGILPSIEMHKIMIQAHLKVKEDILAWNRAFTALYYLNKDRPKHVWDIPDDLTLTLAQNALGKNVAFVLERLSLGELPKPLFTKFITSLISHWVSKEANDPHLAVNMYQTFLTDDQFKKLSFTESQISALICMAKIQKNEISQGLENFEKNVKTWSAKHCYKVYSELVKGYLRNGQVKNALSIYSEAQNLGYVSSPLLESLLENSDKLDISILENLGQVSIDSGCMPCHINEPLLFKRMKNMGAYAKI